MTCFKDKFHKGITRRILSGMILLCLLLTLVPVASAGPNLLPTADVTSAVARGGETVSVSVYMEPSTAPAADWILGYRLSIDYDPAILLLKEVIDRAQSEAFTFDATSVTGRVKVEAQYFGEEYFISQRQEVFTLRFQVNKNAAPAETPVILANGLYAVDYGIELPQENLRSGKVTVVNEAPTASNALINGTAKAGATLTGSYRYADREGNEEDGSTFRWYSASGATGKDKAPIGGATYATLTLTEELAGKYILFEVTPRAKGGEPEGTAVLSPTVGPVTGTVVQQSAEVVVGTQKAVKGSTVQVPVQLKTASAGVASFGIKIAFDASALKVDSITGPSRELFAGNFNNEAGWLIGAWVDGEGGGHPIAPGEDLFVVTFKVNENAASGVKRLTIEDPSDIHQFTLTDSLAAEMIKTLTPGAVEVPALYTVSIGSLSGGSIQAVPTSAEAGTTVNLVITPEEGKRLKSGTLKYNDGTEHAISGTSFTLPASNVTITAEFESARSSGGSSSGAASGSQSNSVPVIINGVTENIGTASTATVNNRTVTTITPDAAKLQQKLESGGTNTVVTIPVPTASDVAVGLLTGDVVKKMENQRAVLEMTTPTASYKIKAGELSIDAVASQLGANVPLTDIKVQVAIAGADAAAAGTVGTSADRGGFKVMAPPVQFTVTASYGSNSVVIDRFGSYVERTVAIPEGIKPDKITTGIIVKPDGSFYHVPTYIRQFDGKYYAVINSLTNSTYAVIWNPVEFSDVADHWAKAAVNSMGSRMIAAGMTKDTFQPDRDITRAEFAAILVRALGLGAKSGRTPFNDVPESQWYAGYIQTAYEHGLIAGYDAKTFKPMDNITREQAMTIMDRAMKLTGLATKLSAAQVQAFLSGYTDSQTIEAYARDSIAACLEAKLVRGRTETTLSPKSNITRAEVAVVVQKLLQESKLIN